MKKRTRLEHVLNRKSDIQGHEFCLTKYGEETILTYRFDATIDIDLYRLNAPIHENRVMSLYGVKRDNNVLFVVNINGKGSQGFGTIVFEKLVTHCENIGIKLITGDISNSDLKDNAERLIEFYKKFGAICEINESKNEGLMTLQL